MCPTIELGSWRSPKTVRAARRQWPSRMLPLRPAHPAWPAVASRPPGRPPWLPRRRPRHLQPPRRRKQDQQQEERAPADLVTGLVRADPAKRHSQRQHRSRLNAHFLSLAPDRYPAVPFLPPIVILSWIGSDRRPFPVNEGKAAIGNSTRRRRTFRAIALRPFARQGATRKQLGGRGASPEPCSYPESFRGRSRFPF
jgi:hypothetical protein